jgi:hypothetical protein
MRTLVIALALLTIATVGCKKTDESPKTETVAQHLKTFDELDFEVFSNQKWERLHESHSKDILVHWPDGHTTTGIDKHIDDLKFLFVFAPNTQIKQHPVKVGQENYTAVTGVMTGTFTQPMPTGNGTFIQPTGKSFTLPMCTVGRWENGVMVEEFLYWDNQSYNKQLGI